jgi:hypothetical protein
MKNEIKATELKEGLQIIELEERLEMAQLASVAAASDRCDVEVN